jgi:hypothetical protein
MFSGVCSSLSQPSVVVSIFFPVFAGLPQNDFKGCYDVFLQMSKLAAVLEQETWVAVDAPDEFQAIVDSLTSTESNGIISPSEEASHGSAADLLDRFSDAPESSIPEETPVPDSTMSQTNGKVRLKIRTLS